MNSKQNINLFSRSLIWQASKDSVIKLNPVSLVKNPVIFIVALGSFLTTIIVAGGIFMGNFSSFNFQIALWLWFTVLFANFAEAIAEGRGKAQADTLRKNRTQTKARRITGKKESVVYANELKK